LLGYRLGDRSDAGETSKLASKEIREKRGRRQTYEMDKGTEQRGKGTVAT
jgi:hypothetical protein